MLLDLYKEYDFIPHDLLIAKLEAYGFGSNSLSLMLSHLTNRIEKVKMCKQLL